MLSTVLIIFYHCNTVVSSVFVEDQIVDFVFDSIRCSTKQLSNNLRNETVNSTKSNKFDSHEYWLNHIQLLPMEQGFVLNNVRFSQRKKKSHIHSMFEIQNALVSVMSIIIKAIY